MIKLTIDNSLCKIEGLSPSQYGKLRKELSYLPNPAQAHFGGYNAQGRRYLIDARGNFPTGLLYLVDKCLAEETVHIVDSRKEPTARINFKLKLAHTPYQEQQAAANSAATHHRGIIVAPTGTGKSLIIALIIAQMRCRALVVVPTLELKRQLSESLLEAFGDDFGKHVFVENIDALDISKPAAVDLVIIDEYHHSAAATYRKLNQNAWTGVYFRVGMTATPFRSQDHERLLLESVLSEVIYRLDYKVAVEKGYIVPLEAEFIDLPPQEVTGNNWPAVYKQLVTNNAVRNKVIAELLVKIHVLKVPTLCLVKEIAHGEELARLTGAAFANGQDENCAAYIKAFNEGKLTALIGTTGVLGEGVDTRPCEIVILAGLGKSKNSIMQQIGRGFRRHGVKDCCKVILFRDTSHKWSLAHFKEQCKIIRNEYGVKPRRLEL